MEEVKDYILVHGIISNIKDNVDKEYIWFDIIRNGYYKDKEGNMKNNPSFFSARINKSLKSKYILDTNIEVVIKGIPKGFVDKKGYRQNYIHVTEINGEELSENIFNKIISYDTDGVMLWNGVRCESEPCTDEELKELEELLNHLEKVTLMNNLLIKDISLNEKSDYMNNVKNIFKTLILSYLVKEIEKLEKEEGKISN